YYFELIEENLKGSFEEIKPISEFIITSAAKFPVESKNITSTFGKREDPFLKNESYHNGIDISAPLGSDICSAWPGIILETSFDEIYGNYVIIEHSEEFFTKYCHLSKICAEEKNFVNAGEKIGEAGSTGRSTGSHLHFEVIINGINIDPKECLEF
ncbi:MAG: M23 family metallopeptidase, partial [Oscillospiraceae bacterium]|nr:M23 family metallopeptidase [Oscillospiraceae bacterium]